MFEVDHPATQAWKRRRLSETSIAVPDSVTFAPVDFERDRLMDRLTANGFDPERRTFFIWLGVTYYLTRAAVLSTLEAVAALPSGAEVAFDYGEPAHKTLFLLRGAHRKLAQRVAQAGEPFVSNFEPRELHAVLRRRGFSEIDDRGPRELFDPSQQYAALALTQTRRPMSRWRGRLKYDERKFVGKGKPAAFVRPPPETTTSFQPFLENERKSQLLALDTGDSSIEKSLNAYRRPCVRLTILRPSLTIWFYKF